MERSRKKIFENKGGGGGEGDLLLICNESCILIDRDIPH